MNMEELRYHMAGVVKFSYNRDLVVSVKGGRIILGQRLWWEDDGGQEAKVFLKHAPSLSKENAVALREALDKAIEMLNGKGGEIEKGIVGG